MTEPTRDRPRWKEPIEKPDRDEAERMHGRDEEAPERAPGREEIESGNPEGGSGRVVEERQGQPPED